MQTDREKLIELIHIWSAMQLPTDCVSAEAMEKHLADYLISKGVTFPVRCKDCKECIVRTLPDIGTIISTHCNLYSRDVNENDFCSYGERKEK